MSNHPNRSRIAKLASLLRAESRSIEVPRSLTEQECADMLSAGLIIEIDSGDARADHRYQATDYAADIIWKRLA